MRKWVLISFLGVPLLLGHAAFAGSLLQVDGRVFKWDLPQGRSDVVVTYALVTKPYSVPAEKRVLSPDNCAAMRPFEEIVAASPRLSGEAAKRELRSAFGA